MDSIKAKCVRGKGVHCKLDTAQLYILSCLSWIWLSLENANSIELMNIFPYLSNIYSFFTPNIDIWHCILFSGILAYSKFRQKICYNPLGLSSLATDSLVPKYNHPSSWFFCVPIGWQNWKVLYSDWLTPVSCWLQVQTLLQKHKTNINMVYLWVGYTPI